jgi:hypothetical protein
MLRIGAVVAGCLIVGAARAESLGSIGGAEIVVNEVKGDLAAGKVVTVLQGDDVYRDEGVKTAPDGNAELHLRDKTVLRVGPSSFVKLDKFVYVGEGSVGAIGIRLVKGSLRFFTGVAAKPSYEISTPTAALGLRGTVFDVEASAFKTRVVLIEGAIRVCVRTHMARCAILDHPGQEATVTVTTVAVADPTSPSAPAAGPAAAHAAPAAAPAAAPSTPAAGRAAAHAAPAAAPATAPSAPAAAPAAAPSAPAAAPTAAPAAAPAAPAAAPAPGAPSSSPGPSPMGHGDGHGVGESGNNGYGHGGNGGGVGTGTGHGGNGGGVGTGTGHGGNGGGAGTGTGHGGNGGGNGGSR